MRVSHVAMLVPRTQNSNLSTYHSITMVIYMATSVPCTQGSNLSIYQSKTTVSHVARDVSTTEKPTQIKNTSNVDRSTKDHTCHMNEVHNMIPISICQKGSHLTISASIKHKLSTKECEDIPVFLGTSADRQNIISKNQRTWWTCSLSIRWITYSVKWHVGLDTHKSRETTTQ
jgi:hypothetical protein